MPNSLSSSEGKSYRVIDGQCVASFSVVMKVTTAIHPQQDGPHHHPNNNQKKYCLELIPKAKKNTPQKLQQQEQQILLQLSTLTDPSFESPFIQNILDSFETQANICFIFDWISGGDLFYHLNSKMDSTRRGFNENEARHILAELFLGINYLHSHDIVHRHIKIENILLDRQGHVKLIDSSLMVKLQPDENHTLIDNKIGSLIYMAPELIQDKVVGRFTDWWAYGLVMYELLFGIIPWSSISDQRIIKRDILSSSSSVEIPSAYCSLGAHQLMSTLLLRYPYSERLNAQGIEQSLFFNTLDWNRVLTLGYAPSYVPLDNVPPVGGGRGADDGDIDVSTTEDRNEALRMFYHYKEQDNLISEDDICHFGIEGTSQIIIEDRM
mmetsp:Transcript_9990/g.13116  ORF Transcript_9990/g.13116 Transcript_9990/m.13116 type:complete len:381 (-) Transcript_9990:190-1332(-)